MALGGGTFITQNKVLPGSYINFVSLASATAQLSDRGVAAMAFELDWGPDEEVFTVTSGDFQKNSRRIFGYDYTDDKLKGLRDLFRNVQTLHAYKLNSGGSKATNAYASACYSGVRGNDLRVVVQTNLDDSAKKDVQLFLGAALVDAQTVGSAVELVDNDYVVWKKEAELTETAAMPLTGGGNGALTAGNHQSFLDKMEAYSFNALGVVSENAAINALYAAYCKRLRDERGIKFQAVVFGTAADYEGVVNVVTEVGDADWPAMSLVYWVTGIIAGCAVNRSNLNRVYDGEFSPKTDDYTQEQLEAGIRAGQFMLHRVGSVSRVLADINSLTTLAEGKSAVFQENQTIRVIDLIGNDIALLFNNTYLGNVPNDESGRISLWSDIVKYHLQLQDIRAIENFAESDVTVEQGDAKRQVVVGSAITVVNAMAQLYMTCVVG